MHNRKLIVQLIFLNKYLQNETARSITSLKIVDGCISNFYL